MLSISFQKRSRFAGRTRSRRREPEEEPPPLEEITATPEEVELSDFLEGLGPQGISEVSLYRILPSGKQRFITSGPPGQFSELYVQGQFGEGDCRERIAFDRSVQVPVPPSFIPSVGIFSQASRSALSAGPCFSLALN